MDLRVSHLLLDRVQRVLLPGQLEVADHSRYRADDAGVGVPDAGRRDALPVAILAARGECASAVATVCCLGTHTNDAEIEQFFAVIASKRDRAIFRLVYHRGLRASELGRLRLSDYDPRSDRLTLHRLKGSNGGQYRLARRESADLRAWMQERGDQPGPMFPGRRGRGLSRQMLDVLVKRYGAAAGIDPTKCHMHAFKHACGTHLLTRGESIEDVQDHLGHRNIQNTLIYARLTNARRRTREERLRDW